MILDCEDNTLAFEKNYEFLGKFFIMFVPYIIGDLKYVVEGDCLL